MTKTLVLDNGYHDKTVVIDCGDETLLKMSLAFFINIHLSVPHSEDYYIKTVHYEELEVDIYAVAFEVLDGTKCALRIKDKETINAFNTLYFGDETVEGCDIY